MRSPKNSRAMRKGALASLPMCGIFAAITLFIALVTLPAQATLNPSWSDVADEIRPVIASSMHEAHITGLSIVLIDGDEIAWSEGFGYSDLFAQTFELSDRALWVEPRQPHFSGKIAVLVNPATISSGEGLAMAIGRLPNATVMGFYGTHGSFGLIPWAIAMPEGFAFEYPIGRSLDANGTIQIDANAAGVGGVQPRVRIPRTAQNIAAYASGVDVELEFARQWLTN